MDTVVRNNRISIQTMTEGFEKYTEGVYRLRIKVDNSRNQFQATTVLPSEVVL